MSYEVRNLSIIARLACNFKRVELALDGTMAHSFAC
jgi:hypothetical protein